MLPEARICFDEGGVDLDGLLRVFDCGGVVSFARVGGGTVREIDGIAGVEGDCLRVRLNCRIVLFGGHLSVSGLLVLLCFLLVFCGRGRGRCRGGWRGR